MKLPSENLLTTDRVVLSIRNRFNPTKGITALAWLVWIFDGQMRRQQRKAPDKTPCKESASRAPQSKYNESSPLPDGQQQSEVSKSDMRLLSQRPAQIQRAIGNALENQSKTRREQGLLITAVVDSFCGLVRIFRASRILSIRGELNPVAPSVTQS
jgi:hypothetical protein